MSAPASSDISATPLTSDDITRLLLLAGLNPKCRAFGHQNRQQFTFTPADNRLPISGEIVGIEIVSRDTINVEVSNRRFRDRPLHCFQCKITKSKSDKDEATESKPEWKAVFGNMALALENDVTGQFLTIL